MNDGQIPSQQASDPKRGRFRAVLRHLAKHRFTLFQAWITSVEAAVSFVHPVSRQSHLNDFNKNRDPTALVVSLLKDPDGDLSNELAPILARLRSHHYSISDLLVEFELLPGAVDLVLADAQNIKQSERQAAVDHVTTTLKALFAEALANTSEVYEYVLESGKSGFCHSDHLGRIVFANKRFKQMVGIEDVEGRSLLHFFEESDEPYIRRSLQNQVDLTKPQLSCLSLKRSKGRERVMAEIRQVQLRGAYRGTYAIVTPVSSQFYLDVFDRCPWGVAWLRPSRRGGGVEFEYANQRALEILGAEHVAHLKPSKLIPDQVNWQKFQKQVAARREGASGDYSLTIRPINAKGRRRIIQIAASGMHGPEGDYLASFVIIQEITEREITKGIYSVLESAAQPREILQTVYRLLSKIIDFDLLTIGVYSPEFRHWAPIYTDGRGQRFQWQTRWFELNEALATWNRDRQNIFIPDFDAFLAQPEFVHLNELPDTRQLQEAGIRSMMRLPVIENQRVVASVGLMSRELNAYGPKDLEILSKLPIDAALLVVLHRLKQRETEFRLQLTREISQCKNVSDFAAILTERLVNHYQWKHVSLFRVLSYGAGFKLVAQRNLGKTEMPIPVDYVQKADQGLLGRAYRLRKTVCEGNVREIDDYMPLYAAESLKAGADATPEDIRSELCVPVMNGKRVDWLINVEDPRLNAFSLEDRENLEAVAHQLQNLLFTISDRYFLETVFDSTSDAVIVTNREGRILRLNRAGKTLLGYDAKDRVRGRFQGRFVDRRDCAEILEADGELNKEMTLTRRDGSHVPIVMSARRLPEELGGNVFVFADWSLEKRLKELEGLSAIHHEVAEQSKLPMALASTWLDRLTEEPDAGRRHALRAKVVGELRKVNLTLDKLAMYDRNERELRAARIPLRLSQVIDRIGDDYALDDWSLLHVQHPNPEPLVLADPRLISFVLESIISYFIRATPRRETVDVEIAREGEVMSAALTGFFPNLRQLSHRTAPESEGLARAVSELMLSETSLRQIVRAHRGKFIVSTPQSRKRRFEIKLPIAQGV